MHQTDVASGPRFSEQLNKPLLRLTGVDPDADIRRNGPRTHTAGLRPRFQQTRTSHHPFRTQPPRRTPKCAPRRNSRRTDPIPSRRTPHPGIRLGQPRHRHRITLHPHHPRRHTNHLRLPSLLGRQKTKPRPLRRPRRMHRKRLTSKQSKATRTSK